jgi:hypothetical protein
VTGLALENERPTVEGVNLLVIHIPVPGQSRASDEVSPRNLRPGRMNNPTGMSGMPGNSQ